MKPSVNIFWFRRDLRLFDNAGLYHALTSAQPVLPIFIFDTDILEDLQDRDDRQVSFIFNAVERLQQKLVDISSTLDCRYGTPADVFRQLFQEYSIGSIYCNQDYESYAIRRDQQVKQLAEENDAKFISFKDQVIFEKLEVCKPDETPYTVFTPYSKKWKLRLTDNDSQSYRTEKLFSNFFQQKVLSLPSLASMGFTANTDRMPSAEPDSELIKHYHSTRDFPALQGTSRLGVHLRFGTVSIRELVRKYASVSETFLNELIWREFYQQILANFPSIGSGKSFKPAYDGIAWRNNEEEFGSWCNGQTGYPIVDAGMRELNATGFMHNRVRMIVASFLTKDLLIDWRWGEAYFARKLLDFDFASNNGGWQWAAGCGCDAAPYFRVFNPQLQTIKFDKKFEYIRKWVPDFQESIYPKPIVDHDYARVRCLAAYAKGLKQFA
jgi:deoxyribodipyrimidine photo-lyase